MSEQTAMAEAFTAAGYKPPPEWRRATKPPSVAEA